MPGQLTLQFKSTYDSMGSASRTVSDWLATQEIADELQYFASLAVEELATNCMKYGYDDDQEHTLEVSLALSQDALVLTFTDDGRAFNPLLVPDPDLDLAAEKRPVGGLGIYLLRQMSDRIEYARTEGKNKLAFHKRLGRP